MSKKAWIVGVVVVFAVVGTVTAVAKSKPEAIILHKEIPCIAAPVSARVTEFADGSLDRQPYRAEMTCAGEIFMPSHRNDHFGMSDKDWRDIKAKSVRYCTVMLMPKWGPMEERRFLKNCHKADLPLKG